MSLLLLFNSSTDADPPVVRVSSPIGRGTFVPTRPDTLTPMGRRTLVPEP